MSQPTGRLRTFINPFGDEFPDDTNTKLIEFEAMGKYPSVSGDRHVLLRWTNGEKGLDGTYTQVIHLTGGPGNYAFYTPSVKLHSPTSRMHNAFYPLGYFTRAQRDQIIQLASSIKFDKNSPVNGCRVWMRDLLEAMVNNQLLPKATLDMLVTEIPLKPRVPEPSAGTA